MPLLLLIISLLLSGITLISHNLIPILEQRLAIKLLFKSKVRPDKISFPIIITEEVIIYLEYTIIKFK